MSFAVAACFLLVQNVWAKETVWSAGRTLLLLLLLENLSHTHSPSLPLSARIGTAAERHVFTLTRRTKHHQHHPFTAGEVRSVPTAGDGAGNAAVG